MDRCKIDGLTFSWIDGLIPHPAVVKAIETSDYDLVFFLAPVPYELDGERFEEKERMERLALLSEQAYESMGYKPIQVPVMPPRKRAEFILEKTIELLKVRDAD